MQCAIERTFIKSDKDGNELGREKRYLQRSDQDRAYGPIETAHLYESRDAATGVVMLQEGQRFVDVDNGQVVE